MAGCLHVVGRGLFGACIPVLVAPTLFVACRSSFSASVPTGEAAIAVRAASVLVDGVCVCWFVVVFAGLQWFVVLAVVGVCDCCCCGCGLWLLPCLWVDCLDIVDTAL